LTGNVSMFDIISSDEASNMVERSHKFVDEFVSRFTNNSVPDDRLRDIAGTRMADKIWDMDKTKIWVADMAMMTFGKFCAMKFMCLSNMEFEDLITRGSLNEIRQVHSTLTKRMSEHMVQIAIESDNYCEQTSTHPSVFVPSCGIGEHYMLRRLFDFVHTRLILYLNSVVSVNGNWTAPTLEYVQARPSDMDEQGYVQGANYAVSFWDRHVLRPGIKAKAWQPR